MKRIVLWVLSTLSTLVVLFGYHTSTSSVMATGSEAAFSGSLSGTATSGSGTSSTTSGAAPPSDTGSSDSSGSTGSSAATTVTGDVAQTRWGPVQVQLEVAGSTITHVAILQYPDSNGRDIEINQYALPQLIEETLDSQGGSVSMVSGATYTSEGYAESLQSALDQAAL